MVIIGLGSNIGNRQLNLDNAIERLSQEDFTNIKKSKVYETQAVLKDDSPQEWNKPFLNMAIMADCNLGAFEILNRTQEIEIQMGRDKNHAIWSPRIIDLDILAIDDVCINTEKLTIPHKLLHKRDFALKPFCDLAPNWRYPVESSDIYDLKASLILENAEN